MKKNNIKKISVLAVLCAMAFICTFVIHFKVAFLTFDLKDAIIAIAALVYGPISGLLCSAVVALIELLTVSDTGFYGFIMNFISSGAFSFTVGIVYKYRRTFGGAILSVISSVFAVVSVMLIANIFITPYYMGVTRSEVITYIPTLLLPFNAVKSILNASVLLIIYKYFVAAFSKLSLIEKESKISYKNTRSIILLICSLAVATAAVLYFVYYLNGTVGG